MGWRTYIDLFEFIVPLGSVSLSMLYGGRVVEDNNEFALLLVFGVVAVVVTVAFLGGGDTELGRP